VIYSFTGMDDGGLPYASPVAGAHGELYGATCDGGTYGYGAVFELQPPSPGDTGGTWIETVLHSFSGYGPNADGVCPNSLLFSKDGALYGTVEEEGPASYGTVFQLTPPAPGVTGGTWTETVLHSFSGEGGDGANPNSLTMSAEGILYGTTLDLFAGHAGTMFELAPPTVAGGAWTETVLHAFAGGADGCYPFFAPVIGRDGSLYGTTYGTIIIINYPGVYGNGTVFKLTPPTVPGGSWTKTVLHDFGDRGLGPDSPLIVRDGTIYGTIGDTINLTGGEIFKLQEPGASGGVWPISILHNFPSGNYPTGVSSN